jgi:hypothetical protein
MQFLGSISNFTAASTILIDSAFGTNLSVTTTFNRAGLATSELKVYDTRPSVAHPGGVTIGDFKLAGIPQGTFQVTGNHQAGGAFNDYTAITFRPTVIAYR